MTSTALVPPPCRAMRKNPRVFGLRGVSCAAVAAPDWVALISLWAPPGVTPSALLKLAAARRAAAVFALVARPVRHHQHAALGAGRSAFVCDHGPKHRPWRRSPTIRC